MWRGAGGGGLSSEGIDNDYTWLIARRKGKG